MTNQLQSLVDLLFVSGNKTGPAAEVERHRGVLIPSRIGVSLRRRVEAGQKKRAKRLGSEASMPLLGKPPKRPSRVMRIATMTTLRKRWDTWAHNN